MNVESVSRSRTDIVASRLAASACPREASPIMKGEVGMIRSGWRSQTVQALAQELDFATCRQGPSVESAVVRN